MTSPIRLRAMLRPALAAVLLAGCEPTGPEQHPVGVLRYPLGLAVEPAGRIAFVANTNFDSRYAGGTVNAVDLETGEVLPTAFSTAAYAGKLVGRANDQGHFDRLYVVTREDGALRWAETSVTDGRVSLSCGAEAAQGALAACDALHTLDGAGFDPYGLVLTSDARRLYSAAFSGQIGIFDVDEAGTPVASVEASAPTGLYGLAVHPSGGGNLLYATSKFRNTINSVRVHEGDASSSPLLAVDEAVVLSSPLPGREFARDIVFSPAGDLAFVAYRGPPAALAVVATAIGPSGVPANTVVGATPLPDSPSGLAVVERDGRQRVYVSLFTKDLVAVVDPVALRVIDLIEVGDGPFDLAVGQVGGHQVLAVTLFREGAVGVIDIEPGSTFEHREIKRIQ